MRAWPARLLSDHTPCLVRLPFLLSLLAYHLVTYNFSLSEKHKVILYGQFTVDTKYIAQVFIDQNGLRWGTFQPGAEHPLFSAK